jgi:mono/diheme cytochrome c family protein
MTRIGSAAMAASVLVAGVCLGQQAQAAADVDRGAYLVNSILACGNCHTPIGPQGPDFSKALSGGLMFEEEPFTVQAANLTSDVATGLGGWTDDEIKAAITQGYGRDGRPLAPVMPYSWYGALTADDLDAVVAYLRTVPAIENKTADPVYKMPIHAPPAPGAEKPVDPATLTDPVAQGHYLAMIGHCFECHTTPGPTGMPDFENGFGKGGMRFPGPWGTSISANITQDPEVGIGAWTDDEIKAAISQGIGRGRELFPPMGFGYYAHLTPADLDALVAFLRTVPAAK